MGLSRTDDKFIYLALQRQSQDIQNKIDDSNKLNCALVKLLSLQIDQVYKTLLEFNSARHRWPDDVVSAMDEIDDIKARLSELIAACRDDSTQHLSKLRELADDMGLLEPEDDDA